MKPIYEHDDYRALIRARIAQMPREGHGQLRELAKALRISPTLISQILNGAKNLTEEQACFAAEFFGFNDHETKFFLNLVLRERAGHHRLKKLYEKELSRLRTESRKMKHKFNLGQELSEEAQAVYYSNWLYTAVHMLSSIERRQSVAAIADYLGVSRPRVAEVVRWLASQGLCKEEGGKVIPGPVTHYLDRDSLIAPRHHSNWRQKAIEAMADITEDDFFFTAPFTVSEKDWKQLRADLAELVSSLSKRVASTDPETLVAINVDLFRVR